MPQVPHSPNTPNTPANPAACESDSLEYHEAGDRPVQAESEGWPIRTMSHAPSLESAPLPEQVWISPGVSPRKRLLTALAILGAAALFVLIAAHEGASMWVSTLIGVVFIGCFIWYLRIVAPTPFTLRLDTNGIARAEPNGAPVAIPWTELARVKEEVFKSGTPISLSFYKRAGERGVFRAFVVYRDDVPRFDALLSAVRAALPEGARWQRETVHE